MSKISWSLESITGLIFPCEGSDSLGKEALARLASYRRSCAIALSAFAFLMLGILLIERAIRDDSSVIIVSLVSSVGILGTLAITLRNRLSTLELPRFMMNVAMTAQMLVSVYLNATLPLYLLAVFPVAYYLLNRLSTAFTLSGLVFAGSVLILDYKGIPLITPELIRLQLAYCFIWGMSHVSHVFFVRIFHYLNGQLQLQKNFSSVLAHEVRTPLATMLGSLEVAKLNGAFERHPVYYDNIKGGATSLLEMVNSTLDYRKIQSGEFEITPVIFQSEMLLNELVCEAKIRLGKKQIKFDVIDHTPKDVLVKSDRTKVKQVLSNLVANAAKFTNSGGAIRLTSTLSHVKNRALWRIEVTDTGIGLSHKELTRVFEPFVQASAGASRKFGGTGLGLTLSQSIAEALSGSLSASSPGVGKGATFIFELPVQVTESAQVEATIEEQTPYHPSLEELKVLLVEDVELNAEIAGQLIEHITGTAPAIAYTAEQALALFNEEARFDVVLMDINLGDGIDGVEAAKRIISTFGKNSPKIYALTASLLEDDKEAVMSSGMDGILAKPVDMNELREAFSQVAEALAIENKYSSKQTFREC